ncbi:MAG: hypothetical protein HOI53_08470 [Francisellaceae bacterium]|nr:hypothetical protein [Francisellaceae bacterium]
MRKYLIKLLVLSTIFCSINTSFAAGDPVQMLSKLADTTLTEIHTYNVEIIDLLPLLLCYIHQFELYLLSFYIN